MKRNKYKDYLWYTALAVFIICVIEGIFFYHNVENPFLKVTLNIQNAIKAYKIDPDIKQAEALAYMQKAIELNPENQTYAEQLGRYYIGSQKYDLAINAYEDLYAKNHDNTDALRILSPRFGDFCYTDAEFSMIKHAVEDFRKMGAEGVVFGVLKPDGTLNMEQMKELMEAAGDMSVTLHRAFDVCVDPIETMEQAISLGINTILTSGQRNVCLQGADLLKELVEKSQGRITIQAGSGVGAEVIRQLYPLTGVRAYHMTGKRVIDSEMQFRKDGVNMGLPMLSEYEIWRTDVDNIRAAKKVLEEL